MDLDKVRTALESLDEEVPVDGAMIREIESYKPYGTVIAGTRNGLLRLGIECIRYALERESKKSLPLEEIVENPLSDLNISDRKALAIQRWDQIEPEQDFGVKNGNSSKRIRWFWMVPIYGVLAVFCTFLLVGAFTVARWFISSL